MADSTPTETVSSASPPLVTFACPVCGAPVEASDGGAGTCPACDRAMEISVFPRCLHAGPAAEPAEAAAPSDATCFFHSASAAQRPCDACGRYLCALCVVELQGGHYCPACIENPASAGLKAATVPGELAYDRLVLALGILWVLFWPSWLVIAPVCWYFTIRYWKRPRRSLIPRSPWRFVLGDVLLFWPALLILLIVLIPRIK